MDFDETFLNQLRDDFVRRVGIDLERLAQRPDRREGLAGKHLPRDDGFLGGVDHLLGNRNAGLKGEAGRDHGCTITGSTVSVSRQRIARASNSSKRRFHRGNPPCSRLLEATLCWKSTETRKTP